MTEIKSRLCVCRGLSGSGKSTLALEILKQLSLNNVLVEHFETDQFFQTPFGYKFQAIMLPSAHSWCRLSVLKHLYQSESAIAIVSNTFTRLWEIKPYIEMASSLGLSTIDILEPSTLWNRDPEECANKNLHGLDVNLISRQLDRWEHLETGCWDTKILMDRFKNVANT